MRTVRTELEIDAPLEAVWAVLTDLGAYETWNPHIVSAAGVLRESGRLDIRVKQGGRRPRALPVTVTTVDEPRRLEWVGTVVHPRVFRGRHTFELEAIEGNRTRLVNREQASGFLVPLVVPSDVRADYESMNRALAARVEGRASAVTGD